MTWPAVLIDEDFPLVVARQLRSASAAPVEITVEGTGRRATDPAQVDRAAALGAVLVSHNQSERGRFRDYVLAWRRRGNAEVAVLFLPHDADPERLLVRTRLLLDWYVTRPWPKPETLVWNDVAQGLIVGFRPPAYDDATIGWVLGWDRSH